MGSVNGRPTAMAFVGPATLQAAAAAVAAGATYVLDAYTEHVRIKFVGASTPALTCSVEWSDDAGSTWNTATLTPLGAAGAAILGDALSIGVTVLNYRFNPPAGCNALRSPVTARVTGNVTTTLFERRNG